MVLVGGHCGETRLLEDKGLKILLRVLLAVFPGVHVDHVEAGLISVHGVQNDLNDKMNKGDHNRFILWLQDSYVERGKPQTPHWRPNCTRSA